MLKSMLDALALPPVPANRQTLVRTLLQEEYGVIPPVDCRVEGRVMREDRRFCAGKAPLKTVELTLTLPQGTCAFPVQLAVPRAPGEHPLLVLLNFSPDVPDCYLPSEEIADRGYAVLSVGYQDVSPDADDGFATGLGRLLRAAAREAGVPQAQLPGKLAVWAWAASRMLDWALTQPGVRQERTALVGHSRLGKTALLAGMLDERFACVFANASGCSGAAITRGKRGEHVRDITGTFPFWFCENYRRYADNEAALPFDQHWLLAAQAPRLTYVSSAEDDEWAGPEHEFLSCVAAGGAWETGLVTPDRLPRCGEALHEGCLGYHLRPGMHYLSREDWGRFLDFLDRRWK